MKLRSNYFLTLIFTLLSLVSSAQLSIEPDSVLGLLRLQQVEDDTFYHAGLFRSQRILGKKSYQDNSLYYSALIATTLKSLRSKVPREESEIIDEIVAGVKRNIPRYRSRKGRHAYNFWPTAPDIPHPNGPAKYQTDKYKLPDDMDDTSMIGLLISESELTKGIRNEMIAYNKARPKKVKTTYKAYSASEAYGVWFADKWVQEFDICVLANTLLFVFESDFQLNRYDSASISLIKDMTLNQLHKKRLFVLSPYYPKKPVILYHLARLLASDKRGVFDDIRGQVLSELQEALADEEQALYRIMLYSSLARLGHWVRPTVDEQQLLREVASFRLFSANLMSAFGSGVITRKVINSSQLITTYHWQSEPYAWLLVYEYLALNRSYEAQTSIVPSK